MSSSSRLPVHHCQTLELSLMWALCVSPHLLCSNLGTASNVQQLREASILYPVHPVQLALWVLIQASYSLCATFSSSGRAYFFQGLSWLLLLKDNEIFQLVSCLASNHNEIVPSQIILNPCWVKRRVNETTYLLMSPLSFHQWLCVESRDMVNMGMVNKINCLLRKQWWKLLRKQWKMSYYISISFWMVNLTWPYNKLVFRFFCLIQLALAFMIIVSNAE